MGSYATIHKITLPLPTVLSVPSGYINSLVGFRPNSVVVYTSLGEYLVELHEGDGAGGYEFRNPQVGDLLTALSIRNGDYLELVSHSNTDLFVRAYHASGPEYNYGRSPRTHRPMHAVRELFTFSKFSLEVDFYPVTLPTASTEYVLHTNLGSWCVQGVGSGPIGCVEFSGNGWERFYRENFIQRGMLLVFQQDFLNGRYQFNVFSYNRDGSLNLFSSGVPTGFNPSETSFYRLLDENAFHGPNQLKVLSRFASRNDSRLRRTVHLRTAGGDFDMEYEQKWIVGGIHGRNYHRRFIRGDWDDVLRANGFRTSPRMKFQMSHNLILNAAQTDCAMFAVEFIPTPAGGGFWPEEALRAEDLQTDDEGSAESSG